MYSLSNSRSDLQISLLVGFSVFFFPREIYIFILSCSIWVTLCVQTGEVLR